MFNGRNTGPLWQYDAAGNVLNNHQHVWTYDMAGRMIQVTDSRLTVTQSYSGDGTAVMRVKRTEVFTDPEGSTDVEYHMRSSVLGNQVVAELSDSEAKENGFVYLSLAHRDG